MHLVDRAASNGRAPDERLREFATAPPHTRMLVCADGSTTVLLEALIGARLSVQVTRQRKVSAGDVPEIGCHLLGVEPEEIVVDRISRILTPADDVISVNRVVIGGPGAARLIPPDEELLGPHLRRIGVTARRDPLGAARGTWPLGGNRGECVSKEYVIDCGFAGRVYVHERFNPGFVPLGEGVR
ncbi:hypothetical protein [Parafrankia discariae]|uniref:hypothetical protein n=1 Tax=Parafrankia discariae TaxID=365528 RepID=UPI0003A77C67|nr:hypothetical protein [Parafrankia discariae]